MTGPVVIDPDALLTFFKPEPGEEIPFHEQDLHLETKNGEDFVCWPFTHHVGIIIPSEIESEDEETIRLVVDVIEPWFDPYMLSTC